MTSEMRERARELLEEKFPGMFDSWPKTEQDRVVEEYRTTGEIETMDGVVRDPLRPRAPKAKADERDLDLDDTDDEGKKK